MGVKTPVVPALIEPEVAGELLPDDAVVVSARPAAARAGLRRFWEGRLRGRVRDVVSAEDFPPRGEVAKTIRKSGESTGFILDLSAPNIGEWLEYATAWDMPAAVSYEVLKPGKPIVKMLTAKWETG